MDHECCPCCGSDKIKADYLDLGFGMQRESGYECQECGWDEDKKKKEEI